MEIGRGDLLPKLELVRVDVVALTFSEAIEEDRKMPGAKSHQASIAAASALSGPGNALLDQAFAEIGIDEAAPSPFDSFAKPGVINLFPTRKTREFLCFEYLRSGPAPSNLSYLVG